MGRVTEVTKEPLPWRLKDRPRRGRYPRWRELREQRLGHGRSLGDRSSPEASRGVSEWEEVGGDIPCGDSHSPVFR